MDTSTKQILVGAGVVIGLYLLLKSGKPKGLSEEAKDIIKQDCLNSGVELGIPNDKMEEYVQDCAKALIEQEEA
jgi:hypothetical protein